MPENSVESNVPEIRCPRCGSADVNFQVVPELYSNERRKGFLWVLLFLPCYIVMLPFLIVFGRRRDCCTETVTYAVCQRCGFRWD